MTSTQFMESLEDRFQKATGLTNRSQYKIFYGPIICAPVLTLGINPGGDPLKTSPDGVVHDDGSIAAASASYYENGENDILDCNWRENSGLLKLLLPLLDNDRERVRTQVVKSNLAFRRSKKKNHIDIKSAIEESSPFLDEIIAIVEPQLVLLTGVAIEDFLKSHTSESRIVAEVERDAKVNQVVFHAALATLKAKKSDALVVRVAHASQFGWTYERYNVVERIKKLYSAHNKQMQTDAAKAAPLI